MTVGLRARRKWAQLLVRFGRAPSWAPGGPTRRAVGADLCRPKWQINTASKLTSIIWAAPTCAPVRQPAKIYAHTREEGMHSRAHICLNDTDPIRVEFKSSWKCDQIYKIQLEKCQSNRWPKSRLSGPLLGAPGARPAPGTRCIGAPQCTSGGGGAHRDQWARARIGPARATINMSLGARSWRICRAPQLDRRPAGSRPTDNIRGPENRLAWRVLTGALWWPLIDWLVRASVSPLAASGLWCPPFCRAYVVALCVTSELITF